MIGEEEEENGRKSGYMIVLRERERGGGGRRRGRGGEGGVKEGGRERSHILDLCPSMFIHHQGRKWSRLAHLTVACK